MSRVAVIGGGISGLAAAHRLIEMADGAALPLRVALFEAGPRLGGVIHTDSIADCVVERGADSFITNKPWAIDLCRRLGLEGRLVSTNPPYRQALVLRKGKPVPVPDGFMLMAPAKIWPVVASPIFSPLGKLRMGLERWIPSRTDLGDESVASFVRRRLGREALERLVQPLVAGIYTSDPEKLSLRATLPRFLEMERNYGSLIRAARRGPHAGNGSATNGTATSQRGPESGARYGLFVTLQDGMSELVEALVGRIKSGGEIHLDARVCGFNRLAGPQEGFSLAFESDEGSSTHATDFDAVIMALPADRAAELVWPLDSMLGGTLGEIEYASSAIVCTGHALADVANPLNGSGLVIPAVENRRILSVSYASRKFAGRAPEGEVVLRTFVGGALQPEMLEHSDDELIQIVRAELGEILGVRGEPRFAVVSRHKRAMPQYHVGHLDRVRRIEELTAAHPRLALAGNAYEGVGIPDCIGSGQRAAEHLFRALASRKTVSP
ncbi:MAG TPA: protoporphyrinogen oxidase [Planctomycetaceae bacterium]|jgi:oxygen-dependent protoporphyrinogen oxidase|nr:protoporphyrinogen oxidase [Planctomycetaceae bacterium]